MTNFSDYFNTKYKTKYLVMQPKSYFFLQESAFFEILPVKVYLSHIHILLTAGFSQEGKNVYFYFFIF
jgi:hypothetical protein